MSPCTSSIEFLQAMRERSNHPLSAHSDAVSKFAESLTFTDGHLGHADYSDLVPVVGLDGVQQMFNEFFGVPPEKFAIYKNACCHTNGVCYTTKWETYCNSDYCRPHGGTGCIG